MFNEVVAVSLSMLQGCSTFGGALFNCVGVCLPCAVVTGGATSLQSSAGSPVGCIAEEAPCSTVLVCVYVSRCPAGGATSSQSSAGTAGASNPARAAAQLTQVAQQLQQLLQLYTQQQKGQEQQQQQRLLSVQPLQHSLLMQLMLSGEPVLLWYLRCMFG
jgi:hypothetical protein